MTIPMMKKIMTDITYNLGIYVYTLLNKTKQGTEFEKIFYVGIGNSHGNIMFSHINNNDLKEIIEEIGNENIDYRIVAYNLSSESANLLESALITSLPNLASLQKGHASDEMWLSLDNLKARESSIDITHTITEPSLIVKLNKNYDDLELLWTRVRQSHRLNIDKANKVKYIYALNKGVVQGVFDISDTRLKWEYTSDGDRIRIVDQIDGIKTFSLVDAKKIDGMIHNSSKDVVSYMNM